MVEVASCTVNPGSIAVGGQSNLTVFLTSEAPQGGTTVLIDTDFDGSDDTLINIPQSIGVEEGNREAIYLLETQAVDGGATKIIFSAHIGDGLAKAAQLNVNY